MKRKTFAFPLGAVVVLLAFACGGPGAEKPPEGPAFKARLYTVAGQNLPAFFTAVGTVQPYLKAQLATRIMGRVERVLVSEGQRVRQGQALAILDRQDLLSRKAGAEAGLAQAVSQYENAKSYYGRIERLHTEQSATRQDLDNARTGMESAGAAVEAARSQVEEIQANLAYSSLTAPFAGVVTGKNVEAGDLASPGVPLITVEQQDSLKVAARVSERDVGLIHAGDTAWVKADIRGFPRSQAVVEAVIPSGDPHTRSFEVKLVLPNPEGRLKSGMFARVYFRTGETEALAVPDSAVMRRGQLTGVYTVDDSQRARLRWIRLGKPSGALVEVLSGLSQGDRIVLNDLNLLREGMPVEEVGR